MQYPIFTQLENDLHEQRSFYGLVNLPQPVEQMLDAVGEYEHGAASIEDICPGFRRLVQEEQTEGQGFAEAMQILAAVVREMSIVIMSQS